MTLQCKYRRIGQIELRKSLGYDEIVAWHPNTYYGKREQMQREGWEFDENGSASRGCVHVHSSCFKNPETCYVVAFVEWNRAHDEYDIRIVGKRYWELDPEEASKVDEIVRDLIEVDDED